MLYDQLKTVALEAWNQITPQGEPTGSYIKILQGPNETYVDVLARLETAISYTVIGEEAKRRLEKLLMIMQIRNVKGLEPQFVRQGLFFII